MSKPSVMTIRPQEPITADWLEPMAWAAPPFLSERAIRWQVQVAIPYVVAAGWRPAVEGELCRHGAGGRGRLACREPAVVTFEKHQSDGRVVPYPYCGAHDGGRVVLGDGRVAEPAGVA